MANKNEMKCIETFKAVLKTNNVELQKKFDFIRGEKGTTLPLDAYFPKQNFVLEYMGKQHYSNVPHFNRRQGRAEQRKKYDDVKAKMLKLNHIELIYFKYDEEINEENVKKKLIEHKILK